MKKKQPAELRDEGPDAENCEYPHALILLALKTCARAFTKYHTLRKWVHVHKPHFFSHNL